MFETYQQTNLLLDDLTTAWQWIDIYLCSTVKIEINWNSNIYLEYWNILLWNCFLQFRGIRKKHSSLFEHDPSSNQVFSIEILFMHLIILWYFNYHFSLHTKRVHLLCPYLTNVWFLLQQWKRRLHIHTLSLT